MSPTPIEIVRQIYDGWTRGDFTVGVERYDRHVLLVLRPEFPDARVTGVGSGATVAMGYYQVWTFRGSSVIRIESVKERDDALEAAGLRD